MIPKPLRDVVKPDIDALVAAETPERRTLDYKEALPRNTDDERKEFLYDISSFANAAGGDLIFGIKDRRDADGKPTGIPDVATGLKNVTNPSAEISRLENSLQSAIDPRIPGIEFREITGFPEGPILVVRVPKSWASPHMVTYKGVSRFYSRNSTGKYPLDVRELRAAFVSSESWSQAVRKFRDDRLARIIAGETPVTLPEGGRVVLHLVPLGAVRRESLIDLSKAAQQLTIALRPIAAQGWDHRFNLDGFLTYSRLLANYSLLFRTGCIEVLDTHLIMPPGHHRRLGIDEPFVSTGALEREIIDAARRCLGVQRQAAITPPIIAMLSLVGTRDARITTGSVYFSQDKIDRDLLLLPEVVFEDFSDRADRILRPVFDALWQSAGLSGSGNYDSEGNWVEPR